MEESPQRDITLLMFDTITTNGFDLTMHLSLQSGKITCYMTGPMFSSTNEFKVSKLRHRVLCGSNMISTWKIRSAIEACGDRI